VRDHDVLSSEPVERHGDGALSRGAWAHARVLAGWLLNAKIGPPSVGCAPRAALAASVVGTLGRRASNVPLVRYCRIGRWGRGPISNGAGSCAKGALELMGRGCASGSMRGCSPGRSATVSRARA